MKINTKRYVYGGAGGHTKMLFGIHFLKNVEAFIDSSLSLFPDLDIITIYNDYQKK